MKYHVYSYYIACYILGLLKRCFTCRSRGDLGTCKDPFTLNSTQAETAHGVEASPCASGWCGKMLEGGNTYKDDGILIYFTSYDFLILLINYNIFMIFIYFI